ncbi:MAG: hypothetical protein AAFR47_05805 [Pseudomonadota bacterium]
MLLPTLDRSAVDPATAPTECEAASGTVGDRPLRPSTTPNVASAPAATARRHAAKSNAPLCAVLAAALPLVLTAPQGLNAQASEDLPGPDFVLDFATGLEVSDNYESIRDPSGTSVVFTNRLGLSFDSQTRNQALSLNAGITYEEGEFADDPDAGGFDRPFIGVDYSLFSRSTLLSFGARYSERDNDATTFVEDPDSSDLTVDSGTRVDTNYNLEFVFGRDAPATFTFTTDFDERRFDDTSDPSLTDQTILRYGSQIDLRLSENTTLNFIGSYRERDEEDAGDTEEITSRIGTGLTVVTRTGLEMRAALSLDRNETTETVNGDRRTETEELPRFNFDLVQARQNGNVTAALSQRLTDTGGRTDLAFGRELDLRNGGELSASFGVSAGENDDEIRPITSITYAQPLPRGQIQASLRTSIRTDDTDGDVISTRGNLGVTRELTRLSSLSLSMNLSASDAVDADGTDRSRSQVGVTYRHQLTRDWSFNTGVRHSISRETDRNPIVVNTVFANLSRQFDLRP